MSKKALVILLLIILFFTGVSLLWMKQHKTEVPYVQPVVQDGGSSEEQEIYPQYIEVIPGNIDEVWYSIPELGVRMRLNKEFAEDLIYVKGGSSSVDFSTKKLSQIVSSCFPEDSPLGYLFKAEGNMKEDAKTDEYLAARIHWYVQIGNYYYGWVPSQEGCWSADMDSKIKGVFPGEYRGNGFKTISDAVKTLEVLK